MLSYQSSEHRCEPFAVIHDQDCECGDSSSELANEDEVLRIKTLSWERVGWYFWLVVAIQ